MLRFYKFLSIYFKLLSDSKNTFLIIITWGLLAALPISASAFTLDIQIKNGNGGKVSITESKYNCLGNCTILATENKVASLIAIPSTGYQFAAWTGECAQTIGPLCTLRTSKDASVIAHFIKANAPKTAAKAFLLLHDLGEKPAVWNAYIKQEFNNHCPIIYGGVILDQDYSTEGTSASALCYRISFGYYALLNLSKSASYTPNDTAENVSLAVSNKQMSNEIHAAVLGILARHPNLSLTLIGHGGIDAAAQAFLQTNTAKKAHTLGLVALKSGNQIERKNKTEKNDLSLTPESFATYKLNANPEQNWEINAAVKKLKATGRLTW